MVTVSVEDRKGRALGEFSVSAGSTTVEAFKKDFAKANPKWYPSRQYFTMGDERLTDMDRTLESYGVREGSTLVFKDLGPQVSWTTVFLVEYFGPILIHTIFYLFPVYGADSVAAADKTWRQKVAFACVIFHYVKRELETLFVHRFSAATMPFFNIFKNSTHYWVLSGLLLAYPLYHPQYTNTVSEPLFFGMVALFFVAELGNLHAHITLRNLRPPGTRTRAVPRGGLFELVSCANYTYELVAWAAFSVFSQLLTGWLFFAVSGGQIYIWAVKKHRRYVKEFPDYPRSRKALVPFLA